MTSFQKRNVARYVRRVDYISLRSLEAACIRAHQLGAHTGQTNTHTHTTRTHTDLLNKSYFIGMETGARDSEKRGAHQN